MISGWLTRCGLRSTALRKWGYIPHSRLFYSQADYAVKKTDVPRYLAQHGFHHHFELSGTEGLRRATQMLADQNEELGEPVGPWTSIVVDRKKTPTVVFAFQNASDAIRTKLILVEHSNEM